MTGMINLGQKKTVIRSNTRINVKFHRVQGVVS